jgi:hypothetical protein
VVETAVVAELAGATVREWAVSLLVAKCEPEPGGL